MVAESIRRKKVFILFEGRVPWEMGTPQWSILFVGIRILVAKYLLRLWNLERADTAMYCMVKLKQA